MKILLSLVIFIAPTLLLATSIQKPEHGVKYRQSAYFMLRMNTGPLAAMVMKKAEFDAEKFRYYAERVAILAKFPQDGFAKKWLAGETAAKEDIWNNKDDFNEKMQALINSSQAMADISKTGSKEDMFNAFKKMGKACKDCHNKYKADD